MFADRIEQATRTVRRWRIARDITYVLFLFSFPISLAIHSVRFGWRAPVPWTLEVALVGAVFGALGAVAVIAQHFTIKAWKAHPLYYLVAIEEAFGGRR